VLTEINQGDLLSKPELPQLLSDLIRAQDATDRLFAAFSIHRTAFICTYKTATLFGVTETDFSIS
jgi:hypothetical protein